MMKRILSLFAAAFLLTSVAIAAGPKDYQVTGPVLDVSDDIITVQKGSDKWEIGRNKDTKINGDLKKGSKVTIQYKMTAIQRRRQRRGESESRHQNQDQVVHSRAFRADSRQKLFERGRSTALFCFSALLSFCTHIC